MSDRSYLDPGQIIQHAYDDATGRLKVDASVSATLSGAQEVIIDQADDSILVYGNDGSTNRKLKTDASGELQVDVLTSALPSGAATAVKQDTGNSSLGSIDGKIIECDTSSIAGTVSVSNFPVSQAVTGTFFQATQPVSIASMPSTPVTGTFWQATQPISASSLPLPTGAATDIKQDTGNNSLSSIDGKITAVNTGAVTISTALPAGNNNIGDVDIASMPTVTVTGALTDTELRATPVPISGTVTANAGTGTMAVSGPLTDTQLRASAVSVSAASLPLPSGAATAALQTQPGVDIGDVTINNSSGGSAVNIQDGGNSITVDGTIAATQSGTWNVGTVATVTNVVHVDDNSSTLSIDDGGGSITVDGIVSLSGTVTVDSELTTADLDTGAGTDTRAVIGMVLAESGGGQLVGSAHPMPISDNGSSVTVDGTIAATQSGTWNITNVSGTVSLPTGAATGTKQDTGNTSLSSIDGKLNSLGQKIMTGSLPVVLASDQTSIPVAAILSAETTKVIGTVNIAAAQTIATTNAGTFAVQAAQSGTWTVQPGNTANTTAWKVDGSAVTQPVSGTVTANAGSGTFAISAASLPLPSGAATSALQTQPGVDIGDVTINNASGASAVNIQDGGNSITVDGTIAATQSGTWNVGTVTTITNVVHVDDNSSTISIDDGAGSITVDGTVTAVFPNANTATLTNISASATSVQLLAANASRKMVMIFNDSSKILYLKLGTTASATSYTTQIGANAYYELPLSIYTGRIDGIWSSASGTARITEY